MHVLIPMSGQGVRFKNEGYTLPKPLIPVNGEPMIARLLKKIPSDWPCTFVLADNHKALGVDVALLKWRPRAQIFYVPENKEGPSLALAAATATLSPEESVLVSYCDYGMKWDPWDFSEFVKNTDCDVALISYRGFHAHYLSQVPYAYSRLEGEFVVEVKEKGSFTDDRESEYASCGAYYFKRAGDLSEALIHQKQINLQAAGEYYTSLTVEALLRLKPNTRARVYEIENFNQWGTPQDLRDYEYWENTYRAWNKTLNRRTPVQAGQILMPMAGKGSRLTEVSALPKPLVPVADRPLYQWALDSFALAPTVLVTLPEIARALTPQKNQSVVSVSKTPQGQALTTEIGLSSLDFKKDVIVTACDHGIAVEPRRWEEFKKNPDCDAAILTVRGYPGAHRRPLSFSYVAHGQGPFPLVQTVSLKKPLSSKPSQDSLLTGTFWFASPQVAEEGIALLKATSQGSEELYLDSIFNHLIAKGRKVRAIEVPGYINWGDATSLKEALYWQEFFMGRKLNTRSPFPGCL